MWSPLPWILRTGISSLRFCSLNTLLCKTKMSSAVSIYINNSASRTGKQTFHPLEFVRTASWQHAHFTCPHPPSPLGKSTAFPMRTELPPQRDWEEFLCPCRSFQTLRDDKKIFDRITPASWSSAVVSEELREYWLVTSCEAPRADSLRPLLLQHLINFHRFRRSYKL